MAFVDTRGERVVPKGDPCTPTRREAFRVWRESHLSRAEIRKSNEILKARMSAEDFERHVDLMRRVDEILAWARTRRREGNRP